VNRLLIRNKIVYLQRVKLTRTLKYNEKNDENKEFMAANRLLDVRRNGDAGKE
jgi:hypothetical protein